MEVPDMIFDSHIFQPHPSPEIAGVPYDQGLWKPIGFP